MYIAIYCVVIVLFCAGAIFLFCYFRNRDKKRIDEFNRSGKLNASNSTPSKMPVSENKGAEHVTDVELAVPKSTVDAKFEDFELSSEDEKETNEEENPYEINLKTKGKETSLEDKFAEYENFLRRHMANSPEATNPENVQPFAENARRISARNPIYSPFTSPDDIPYNSDGRMMDNNSELDELANFDFRVLNGKTDEEIDAILSTLSPRAQEIIRRDILKRRDLD